MLLWSDEFKPGDLVKIDSIDCALFTIDGHTNLPGKLVLVLSSPVEMDIDGRWCGTLCLSDTGYLCYMSNHYNKHYTVIS